MIVAAIGAMTNPSPRDLRAQVKFQVDGGPRYVIKAIRVDVREPFINHLIAFLEETPIESEGVDDGEDVSELDSSDNGRIEEIPKTRTSYSAGVNVGVPGLAQVWAKWERER